MDLPPDPALRRLNIAIGIFFLFAFLTYEASRELDPLAGAWTPTRLVMNGAEQPVPYRIFLDIADGRAEMAYYWTCGARGDTYAEGEMAVNGKDIALHEVDEETRRRNPVASYWLTRLPTGGIGFSTTIEGTQAWLEFRREENITTVFDLVGWK